MAYATDREDFKIDESILDTIEPSMPPEFAQLREEKNKILAELAEGDPSKQAALRGRLLTNSVKSIQVLDSTTPDNFRSGVAVEVPGRSFRMLPKEHTGQLVEEYPSTAEVSAK